MSAVGSHEELMEAAVTSVSDFSAVTVIDTAMHNVPPTMKIPGRDYPRAVGAFRDNDPSRIP